VSSVIDVATAEPFQARHPVHNPELLFTHLKESLDAKSWRTLLSSRAIFVCILIIELRIALHGILREVTILLTLNYYATLYVEEQLGSVPTSAICLRKEMRRCNIFWIDFINGFILVRPNLSLLWFGSEGFQERRVDIVCW
jgi:hypothetical protein